MSIKWTEASQTNKGPITCWGLVSDLCLKKANCERSFIPQFDCERARLWYLASGIRPSSTAKGTCKQDEEIGLEISSRLRHGALGRQAPRLGCRWSQDDGCEQDPQQDWIFAVDLGSSAWLLEENGQASVSIREARTAVSHPPYWVIPQIWDKDYFWLSSNIAREACTKCSFFFIVCSYHNKGIYGSSWESFIWWVWDLFVGFVRENRINWRIWFKFSERFQLKRCKKKNLQNVRMISFAFKVYKFMKK